MKQSRYIELLGQKVYVEYYQTEESPSQYTFLLVHGFLSCTYCFHQVIPYLSREYDTYCLDLVGFGKSDKPADYEYSYHNYATLLIQFIKTMGLKNVILMGHSMGGQICLYTVKEAPNLIHSLILVCCSGYIGSTKSLLRFISYLPISKPLLHWWLCCQSVEKVLASTVYNKKLITKDMVKIYSEPLKEKNFRNTLIGLVRNREGDLDKEVLRNITHPILLIWGEEDSIVPLNKGVQLRVDLPASELVVIPEAGHQVIEEKPVEVFKEIVRWLRKI